MITGIEVPLEMAALLGAVCAVAGVWTGRLRAGRLADLLRPAKLSETIKLAARRHALRAGSPAVLHGRIDQLGTISDTWHTANHDEMREHVAAVLRAGLRRDDRVAFGRGNDFTISVTGANAHAAVGIADRLRRKLSRLRLPHLQGEAQLTASFGVAAERIGEGPGGLDRRARGALRSAVAKGTDHVVAASEIEEILLLPAPVPSQAYPSSASAA